MGQLEVVEDVLLEVLEELVVEWVVDVEEVVRFDEVVDVCFELVEVVWWSWPPFSTAGTASAEAAKSDRMKNCMIDVIPAKTWCRKLNRAVAVVVAKKDILASCFDLDHTKLRFDHKGNVLLYTSFTSSRHLNNIIQQELQRELVQWDES